MKINELRSCVDCYIYASVKDCIIPSVRNAIAISVAISIDINVDASVRNSVVEEINASR